MKLLSLLFIVLLPLVQVHAQKAANDDELEALYDKYESEEVEKAQPTKSTSKAPKQEEVNRLSDLANLAPFEDIAVIQRRFLPRSERFELSASGLVSTNNQFFNNVGIALKGTYYFKEKFGVELSYFYLSSSEKDVTTGLKKRQIQTESLVEPESYMGAAFKWSPVYGKVAWFQEKIIPFDIYFSPGLGLTSTALGESEMTFSLAGGQSFAISKSSAIRWDLTWNFYQATVRINSQNQTRSQDDLFIMIGYSYYIPEATYR